MSGGRGVGGDATRPEERAEERERVIEAALEPGYFVSYRRSHDFVQELEEVRERILPPTDAGPEASSRAVRLVELFIAGCYEKAEEIDDSGGVFGQFVGELFCDWIRVRQASGADPDETARMLLSWMANDDYGFCYEIERRAVDAFDTPGLSAFEAAVRAHWDTDDRDDFRRRRRVEILKAIHIARGDAEAYASLCEQEGGPAPRDCEELAGLCLRGGRAADALSWVDRGVELEARGETRHRDAWDLPGLRRRALLELGREEEALASAWEDFQRFPSAFAYAELVELAPAADREEWQRRALDAAEAAELRLRLDLFIETSEVERLAESVTHAPDGELLVLSLDHLERVRDILLEEGRSADWHALVSEIRSRHGRKSRFMPGFERLVAGDPARGPSFLDRARVRWQRGAGEGGDPS